MLLDPLHYPYPSRRSASYGRHGMIAASQPLAAQAGMDILKRGGNAVDAAIATAAALTVVEPTGCGLGGDAFALVWIKDKLYGLNGSGPAPAALSPARLQADGYQTMPALGWQPVTVPGQPAAWAALSKRFGRLPLGELLAPAIGLARDGFPVSPVISQLWAKARRRYQRDLPAGLYRHWARVFAPHDRAPGAGQLFTNPELANSLTELAESGAESFYRGALARQIAAAASAAGGYLSAADLAGYQVEWVDPIHISYRGVEVWELPPNGQGLVALQALNIVQGMPLAGPLSLQTVHAQVEALKLAYADAHAYLAEPAAMPYAAAQLLSPDYAAERRRLITDRAQLPSAGAPEAGGTVYLATADGDGNMVSFIQSNYQGFGSGVVVPGTGISLHNRGLGFSLTTGHPNCLAPGKRPYHTIIPGFLTRQGQALGPFGVMGAYMQPQGQMQVVMNMLDFGLNPQAALDAPRWQWLGGLQLGLEAAAGAPLAQQLAGRGHQIQLDYDSSSYGRGQVILRDPLTGVLCGGTEARTDGCICSW